MQISDQAEIRLAGILARLSAFDIAAFGRLFDHDLKKAVHVVE